MGRRLKDGRNEAGYQHASFRFAFTTDNEVADRLDYGIYPKKKGIYNGDFKTYVVGHKHKERRVRLQ